MQFFFLLLLHIQPTNPEIDKFMHCTVLDYCCPPQNFFTSDISYYYTKFLHLLTPSICTSDDVVVSQISPAKTTSTTKEDASMLAAFVIIIYPLTCLQCVGWSVYRKSVDGINSKFGSSA